MTQWWLWQPSAAQDVSNSFAVIGVGRFGSAVCKELIRAGAEVLAIDLNSRAIDELLQQQPAIGNPRPRGLSSFHHRIVDTFPQSDELLPVEKSQMSTP